ncbi:unnamed protein product [Pedinophyceae sp. YPF-701]|nr:unnamed protein product [Pedinophyceae sp. YPF-701]
MLALTQALQNMDLNIVKGRVRDSSSDPDLRRSTFFITDKHTSDKVLKSEKLEDIRLAVEYTLLEKFPEEGAKLAAADRRDVHRQPRKDGESVVPTRVTVEPHESGTRSILRVKTRDYPGILTEIVRVLKDINLNVTYAEINTVGREVDDTFYVTYHGAALDHNMELLVTNCLQYYISLFELERDESY